jgi:hypothetical protein
MCTPFAHSGIVRFMSSVLGSCSPAEVVLKLIVGKLLSRQANSLSDLSSSVRENESTDVSPKDSFIRSSSNYTKRESTLSHCCRVGGGGGGNARSELRRET